LVLELARNHSLTFCQEAGARIVTLEVPVRTKDTARRTGSGLIAKLFGAVTVIFALAAFAFTVFSYQWRGTVAPESVRIPPIIEQARPESASPELLLDQAQQHIQQGKPDQGLVLLASVAKYAPDPSLQARAVLVAGTVLETQDRANESAELFRYFISRYQGQPGLDGARYHLALREIQAGHLANAESLLTAVLRDSPNSPVASSATYLAAATARVLANQESSANGKVGGWVASFLPMNSAAMAGFVLSFAIALLTAYIKIKDEKRLYTIALVLLVFLMSVYSLVANQREKARDIRQIAGSGSLR
jgi:tetratricopeptide (TPR) repeat protein